MPAEQSQHNHLTIIHSDEPLQIVTAALQSTCWHRFPHALHDDGIISELSNQALRALSVFLRLNDDRTGTLDSATGLVHAPIPKLMEVMRRRRTFVYEATKELLSHPARLLSQPRHDHYHVLPGMTWAGRPRGADEAVREVRTNRPQGADERLRERARANQPREEDIRQNQNIGGNRTAGLVAGWPRPSAIGNRAIETGDVRGLLVDLGVWAYMSDALAACSNITVAHVLQAAAALSVDVRAGNKPLLLGKRLSAQFGVPVPPPPSARRYVVPDTLRDLEAVVHRRKAKGY